MVHFMDVPIIHGAIILNKTDRQGETIALQRKALKAVPVQIEQDSDRFIVGCPIWAGF